MADVRCSRLLSVAQDGSVTERVPTREELIRAADILGEAFAEDNVTGVFVAEGRAAEFEHALLNLTYSNRDCIVLETDNFGAVAFVAEDTDDGSAPPPTEEERASRREDPKVKALMEVTKPECRRYITDFVTVVAEPRRAYVKEHGPVYHLQFIGTSVGSQGQGLGGRLLTAITALAARTGHAVFLEASTDASARLYARMGYVAQPAVALAGGQAHLIPMVLGPAGAAAVVAHEQ